MKCWSIFIFLLAFFLNAVLASEEEYEEGDPYDSDTSQEKTDVVTDLPSPEPSKPNDCLSQFSPIIQFSMIEIKNQSLSCVKRAEDEKKIEMASIKEYQAIFLQKLSASQNSFISCTQVLDAFEYLECLRAFSAENREAVYEFDLKTERFSNQINKIKTHMNICSNISLEMNEHNIVDAFSDFKTCLLSELQDVKESPANLEKIVESYRNLHSCWGWNNNNDDLGYKYAKHPPPDCLEAAFHELNEANIKDALVKNSAEYFSKFHEIDRNKNKCLRFFVTKYIFPDFRFGFELQRFCFTKDHARISDDNELNNGLNELKNSLQACQHRIKSAHIVDCLNMVLSKDLTYRLEMQLNLKSEEELKDLNRRERKFDFDDACLGYFWRRLQFRGLSMDTHARTSLEDCLYRFYT